MEELVLTHDQRVYYKTTLDPIVKSLVGDNLMDAWWHGPNKAFNGMAPIHVLDTDDFYKVEHYLVWHAYCAGG